MKDTLILAEQRLAGLTDEYDRVRGEVREAINAVAYIRAAKEAGIFQGPKGLIEAQSRHLLETHGPDRRVFCTKALMDWHKSIFGKRLGVLYARDYIDAALSKPS